MTTTIPEPGATLLEAEQGNCELGHSSYSFNECYTLLDRLRSGAYGTVYVVQSKHPKHAPTVTPATTEKDKDDEYDDSTYYAVKEIKRNPKNPDHRKEKENDDSVLKEVGILYDLRDLPQSIGYTRLVDFFIEESVFYFVQTYAEGGDVFDMLAKRKKYTEKDMRDLVSSLLVTLRELHDRKIVHRDLKPENLLLKEKNNNSTVLVADFGFASYLPKVSNGNNNNEEHGYLHTRCGTPAFVAPEILMGKPYNTKVDVWSVGCLMYMLLGGYPPFNDPTHRGLFRKIKAGDYVFHSKAFHTSSVEIKQLISSFLTVDPEYRCSAKTAYEKSLWIHHLSNDTLENNDLSNHALSEIKSFSTKRKFRGVVHAVVFTIQQAKFFIKDYNPCTAATTDVKDDDAATTTTNAFNEQLKKWDQEETHKGPETEPEKRTSTTLSTSTDSSTTDEEIVDLISKNIHGSRFHDHYELLDQINEGSAGKVYECVKKNDLDTTRYAVKIIPKKNKRTKKSTEEAVLKEVSVMQHLHHKHIVKLYDFYESDENDESLEDDAYGDEDSGGYFYLILELMTGGDVFDRIVQKYQYTEKDARGLAKILLTSIDYMHSQGFTHRDLKPQNLLLTSEHDDADIKIADFGAACRVHAPQTITTRCGTPTYVAPEILKNIPYDQSADLWSIGVIIYVLLCGYPPFMEENQSTLFQKIRSGDWYFEEEDWKDISPEAKEVVEGLLQVEPAKRLTARQALDLDWIQQIPDQTLSTKELNKTLDTIKKRKARFRTVAKSIIGMGAFRKSIMDKAVAAAAAAESATTTNNDDDDDGDVETLKSKINDGNTKINFAGIKDE